MKSSTKANEPVVLHSPTMYVLITSVRHCLSFLHEYGKRLVGYVMSLPVHRTRMETCRLQFPLVAVSCETTACFSLLLFFSLVTTAYLWQSLFDIFAQVFINHEAFIQQKTEESFGKPPQYSSCSKTLEIVHQRQTGNSSSFGKRGEFLFMLIYCNFWNSKYSAGCFVARK